MPRSRLAVVCDVTDTAVVLGSAQPESLVSGARTAGALAAPVVRRRSGGGAVLVSPSAQCWVDVFLPAGDPLLDADVGRSFLWLGSVWAAALELVGVPGSAVEVSAPGGGATAWASLLCFGGLGAGEVTVDGRKVVGISQRRDRDGAWFHSMALVADRSAQLVAALNLLPADRASALAWLDGFAGIVTADPAVLADALLASLP